MLLVVNRQVRWVRRDGAVSPSDIARAAAGLHVVAVIRSAGYDAIGLYGVVVELLLAVSARARTVESIAEHCDHPCLPAAALRG